jgi:hypothetical protein
MPVIGMARQVVCGHAKGRNRGVKDVWDPDGKDGGEDVVERMRAVSDSIAADIGSAGLGVREWLRLWDREYERDRER